MEEKKLNVTLKPEVADGIYSNLAMIGHSSSEFIVDFIRVLPGAQNAEVKSRIILTPEHAKKLLMALQENIAKYESQFGPIKIQGNPMRGSTLPMSFGGEA